jgi:hypothetical protein
VAFLLKMIDRGPGVRPLRGTFYVGGAVAALAGAHGMLGGARGVPGLSENVDPVLESELRFYSAFYLSYGLSMLSVARRADRDATATRALMAPLFLAGLARVIGWISVGRPNRAQRVLLAIELGGPPLITAWQARVSAR